MRTAPTKVATTKVAVPLPDGVRRYEGGRHYPEASQLPEIG